MGYFFYNGITFYTVLVLQVSFFYFSCLHYLYIFVLLVVMLYFVYTYVAVPNKTFFSSHHVSLTDRINSI